MESYKPQEGYFLTTFKHLRVHLSYMPAKKKSFVNTIYLIESTTLTGVINTA